MKRKTRQKPRHIVARSITLTDSKGRSRIHLSAEDDYAVIAVYGSDCRSVQISCDPDGSLGMNMHNASGKIAIGMSILANGNPGVSICDHRNGMVTLVGAGPDDTAHEVSVFQRGKLHWTSRKTSLKTRKRKSG
jgi:hypothetical protein